MFFTEEIINESLRLRCLSPSYGVTGKRNRNQFLHSNLWCSLFRCECLFLSNLFLFYDYEVSDIFFVITCYLHYPVVFQAKLISICFDRRRCAPFLPLRRHRHPPTSLSSPPPSDLFVVTATLRPLRRHRRPPTSSSSPPPSDLFKFVITTAFIAASSSSPPLELIHRGWFSWFELELRIQLWLLLILAVTFTPNKHGQLSHYA